MPAARTSGDVIRAHAAANPDAAAILAPGRAPLSYAALAAFIDETRERLNGWGIGLGDRVALAVGTRPEMGVAVLAVSDSATAVPLDPDAKAAEIEGTLVALRAGAVIVSDGLNGHARACASRLGIQVLTLFPRANAAAGLFTLSGGMPGTPARPGPAGPEDVAWVMRTSGTTAAPKVVPIRHRLAAARGRIEAAAFGLGPADRCLNFRPTYVHSAINAGLMVPLAAGGGVIMPAGFDAGAFFEQLETFGATWFLGSPAYHDAILEQLRRDPGSRRRHALRFVRSSSYRLTPEAMATLEATFGVPFLERFGGTESGLIARNPPPPAARKPGTVGVPVDSEVALLDDAGVLRHRDVAGEIGEIVVRGEGVFDGYEDNPEADAAAFRDGWYRTGDLGKWDDDGYLTVCGRVKEVINRGGQKISPVEVEDVLLRHPRVAEVACFAVPHPTLGEDIAAAIVVADPANGPLDEAAVAAFLAPHLAAHKVPKRVVCRDALPRGPTGKLHRLSLAAALGIGPAEATPSAGAPRSGVPGGTWEAEIAAIWRDVLKRDGVGIGENFFTLGGESLMAARMLARIGEATGIDLPLECVFGDGGTVAGLARLVRAAESGGAPVAASSAVGPIARRGASAATPLTFSQERLRFLSELDPNDHIYNTQGAVRLTGRLDPRILRRVLNAIVARHEILRASFPIVDGALRQVIAPALTLEMPVVDLAEVAPDRREDAVQRIAREEGHRRYDLARGPLIRAKLIRCAADDHVLLLPKHHMVFDGQSGGILYREIAALYGAFARGEPSPLAELPIQFGDYAAWQRERLAGPRLDKELAYWLDQLDGAPPLLDLPTDRPRPDTQSYRGGRCWFSLSSALTGAIESFSRRLGVTPFITLLAGFELLLHRYSGQDDFVLGTVVGGRNRPEVEDLLGLFVNTLALRARFDGVATIAEHVARVRQAAVGAYAHQDMPFDRLVEALNPDRSAAYAPVVQVLFGLMPKDLRRVELGDLTFERMNIDLGTARFDLSVMIGEDHGAMEGFFEYSDDLFDRATIERMIGHFETLLGRMVAREAASLADIDLLSDAERALILGDWSGAPTGPANATPIHRAFEAWAARTPDAIAVEAGRQSVSYAALDRWASAVARRIADAGAMPGDIVAISAERRPELIAGMIGILKAGCAYLPVDLTLPHARLRLQVEGAGAKILLAHGRIDGARDGLGVRTVAIDSADETAAAAGHDVAPDSPAYIMFTSGSSGTPKGVVVPHCAVMRLVRDAAYAQFGPDEAFLQLAPASFDAATFEIWGCLLNGGRLVQVAAAQPSLREIAATIRDRGVTTAWLTAGLFHQMVDHELDCFAGVRQVLAGGDVLSPAHVARFVAAMPGCRLINGYGPTENTTFTTTHAVERGHDAATPVPIGRPIDGTSVYILDRDLKPVPAGVPGELYAGGLGLALGYLDDADLTAARFIADPFSDAPGARLYRTGDRARFRADGRIEFLGRNDDQVKIRGFRVEPGEVAAILQQHPGVAQAAVVARSGPAGETGLAAYVVAAGGGGAADAQALRTFLGDRLPPYMVPAEFALLGALPLTANGKVDRARLAAFDADEDRAKRRRVPPRTPIERILADIWSALLQVDPVGIDDNFFDLGGHSLTVMRLANRIYQETGEALPLRTVFDRPTIRALAEAVVEQMLASDPDARATEAATATVSD